MGDVLANDDDYDSDDDLRAHFGLQTKASPEKGPANVTTAPASPLDTRAKGLQPATFAPGAFAFDDAKETSSSNSTPQTPKKSPPKKDPPTKKERVVRAVKINTNAGHLGVTLETAKGGDGAVVAGVDANDLVYAAGLRQGDTITAINGKPVTDHVAALTVMNARDEISGKGKTINIEFAPAPKLVERTIDWSSGHLGVALAKQPKVGVCVTEADPNDLLYKAGLRVGDVIKKVGGKAVSTHEQAMQALEAGRGKIITLQFATLNALPEQPAAKAAAASSNDGSAARPAAKPAASSSAAKPANEQPPPVVAGDSVHSGASDVDDEESRRRRNSEITKRDLDESYRTGVPIGHNAMVTVTRPKTPGGRLFNMLLRPKSAARPKRQVATPAPEA